MNPALRLVQGLTPAQRHAEPAVARLIVGAGEHEIAQAGESHERVAHGAQLDAQTHHFGEPARDQRHSSVGAETHAVGDTRTDRYDVLDPASDLDTHDVG